MNERRVAVRRVDEHAKQKEEAGFMEETEQVFERGQQRNQGVSFALQRRKKLVLLERIRCHWRDAVWKSGR